MPIEFRKEALKKLSAPDDLDKLMPVTDRRGWIALAAIGVFLGAALIWSVFGEIYTTVNGVGMTMETGEVKTIRARTGGLLSEFSIHAGDPVQKGQVLAIIQQPGLKENFLKTFSQYSFLESHQDERSAFYRKQITLQEQKIAELLNLYNEGLVEKIQLSTAERELMTLKDSFYELKDNLMNATLSYQEAIENYQWQAAIFAPFSGIVTEIEASNNTLVTEGQSLLQLESQDAILKEDINLDIYIASQDAKKIQEGMLAYISPGTVKAEKDGYIIGRVRSISQYPVSVAAIQASIKNEQLANNFAKSSPPYRVRIHLLKNEASYSGFQWTSGAGPAIKITEGILCTGKIIVEQEHPIELVIPMLKHYVLGQAG